MDSEITPQYGNNTPEGCPDLIKIEIPFSAKSDICKELNVYGINRVSLFPDLEGLSKQINWEISQSLKQNY